MTTETQGKTDKNNINQGKEQTQQTELESPKAGTATSSPTSSMEPSNKQSILHDAVNEERKPMLSELLEELLWS